MPGRATGRAACARTAQLTCRLGPRAERGLALAALREHGAEMRRSALLRSVRPRTQLRSSATRTSARDARASCRTDPARRQHLVPVAVIVARGSSKNRSERANPRASRRRSSPLLERRTQFVARLRERRGHCSFADPADLGDLGVGQVTEVAEKDDQAPSRREPLDGVRQLGVSFRSPGFQTRRPERNGSPTSPRRRANANRSAIRQIHPSRGPSPRNEVRFRSASAKASCTTSRASSLLPAIVAIV